MIPIATKTAAKALVKSKTQQVKNRYNNSSDTIKKVVWGVFGAIVVFFVGRFIVRRIKRNNTLNQLADNPDVQQAALIRGTLNPSGSSWLMWGDGTKEQNLYSAASQITDLKAVSKAYQNMYNSNMLLDIQGELSSNEYTRFLNSINKQANYSNNNANTESTSKNKLVVVTASQGADFYSSLKSFGLPFQSVAKLNVNTRPFNGFSTGKIHIVSLFGSSLTQQYRVLELKIKTKEGNWNKAYVHAGSVKLIDNTTESKKQFTAIQFKDAAFS